MQVSCIDVSKDGSMLAMGTLTTIGVPSHIYLWDVKQLKLRHTLSLHKASSQESRFLSKQNSIAQ